MLGNVIEEVVTTHHIYSVIILCLFLSLNYVILLKEADPSVDNLIEYTDPIETDEALFNVDNFYEHAAAVIIESDALENLEISVPAALETSKTIPSSYGLIWNGGEVEQSTAVPSNNGEVTMTMTESSTLTTITFTPPFCVAGDSTGDPVKNNAEPTTAEPMTEGGTQLMPQPKLGPDSPPMPPPARLWDQNVRYRDTKHVNLNDNYSVRRKNKARNII